MPPEDDDPPDKPERPSPPPLRPSVRAFLSRKDVSQWVHDRVRDKVAARYCQEVAQDVMQATVEEVIWPEASPDAEEKVLWGTLMTVTDRKVADHHEKRRHRRPHEGNMPKEATRQDEVGRHVPDEDAVRDESEDPRTDTPFKEGILMRRYFARVLEGNERDAETYRWMVENVDEETTFEQISERTGVPLGTVHWRVADFKERHLPRYTRWRNNSVIVILLLLLGVAIFFAVRWKHAHEPGLIGPVPDSDWATPSASASSAPVPPAPPPSFDNALPTQPDPRLKP